MAREERVSAAEDREATRGRPPGPKEAARPKRTSVDQTARRTDSWRRSGLSDGKAVPRGGRGRPAGLGLAARPHFAASGVQPSREDQALLPLLRTTGATRNNRQEPTLAHYK